jgi:hypothetical protein
MAVKINKNIISVPFVCQNNMEAIKNILISQVDVHDEIGLNYLSEFFIGFLITNSIITLVAQISMQYKNHGSENLDSEIQRLESVRFYYQILTREKSCIFFRNCIAVIESIIVTIDDYMGLKFDQRRDKFLQEVEILNSPGISARLLTKPSKKTIVMHRKAMSLRIRSRCQADPIYKKQDLFTTSKVIWDKLQPEQFIIFFERYTNINTTNILKYILKNQNFQNINFLLSAKIFSLYNSEQIEFNEFIGINTVPLEYYFLQFSNKCISRLNTIYKLNLSLDFTTKSDPLAKILELQSQKLSQPGGLKSKKCQKR